MRIATHNARNGSTRRWRNTRARMLRQLPAICGICGTWITDPQQADVDHIVPVQSGGTDNPANLRLTHARCNRGRRVKIATPQSRAPIAAPKPGDWRTDYPTHWPPDPDPGNMAVDWSRHWWTAGEFNPRCWRCRELGRPCEAADPTPDAA